MGCAATPHRARLLLAHRFTCDGLLPRTGGRDGVAGLARSLGGDRAPQCPGVATRRRGAPGEPRRRCPRALSPPRRAYEETEQEGLADLFGAPARWATTLKPLLWTQLGATVPAFAGETRFELQVPCTVDLNVASGKYFQSLASGAVPLLLLFSGT